MASLYDCCGALDYCKSFFAKTLKEFNISLVVLFGSATYPGCFDFETSDLDIIAITDSSEENLSDIAEAIANSVDFSESYKKPIVIKDCIGERVEFLLLYNGVAIDCTVMLSLLPDRRALMETAVYDSADLLIGAIVKRGIVLLGDEAKLTEIGSKYEPYYDEELRAERLKVLANYLHPKTIRIKELLKDNDPEVIDYFFRYRVVFLKYIFCYFRQYPVNYHKHLNYQASEILDLSKKEKDILLQNSSDNWKDSINNFIEMYERCLSCGQ